MHKPMTLLFDPFESVVLFFSGEAPTCSFRRLLADSDCAILVSFSLQLRCARWQITLVEGHDSHMYVLPLFVQTALPCSMTDTVNTPCR